MLSTAALLDLPGFWVRVRPALSVCNFCCGRQRPGSTHGSYIVLARFVNRHLNSTAMPTLRTLLLTALLAALQFILSVDAKGGGKSSGSKGSKGSKPKPKPKPKPRPQLLEEQRCYNAQYVILLPFAPALSSPPDTQGTSRYRVLASITRV